MAKVTDPELLKQLQGEEPPAASKASAPQTSGKVTDPALLEQLNTNPAVFAAKEALSFLKGSADQALDVAGGVVEQIPAGLGAIAEQAVYGPAALYTGLLKKLREDTPYPKAFEEEYARLRGDINPLNFVFDSLQPQTDTGQLIFHKLGEWMDKGLTALSDRVFEHGLFGAQSGVLPTLVRYAGIDPTRGSPAIAAGIKSLGAGAALVGPAKLGGEAGKKVASRQIKNLHEQMDRDLKTNPSEFMAKYYPDTWRTMQDASVGKVKVGSPAGIRNTIAADARNTLEGMGAGPIPPGLSLSELIRRVIVTADKAQEINPNARSAIVDAFVERIDHLANIEEKMVPKALPAPSAIPGVIEVTPSGKAATAAQRAAGGDIFRQLSNEQRAEVTGLGTMGELRTAVESFQRAQREANGKTTGEVELNLALLKQKWRNAFPLQGKATAQARDAVFAQWMQQGAPYVPWADLNAKINPPPAKPKAPGGKRKKQAGSLDIEGLEKLPQSAAQAAAKARIASMTPLQGTDDAGYNKVEGVFNRTLAEAKQAEKKTFSDVAGAFRDKVADHQGTLRRTLERQGKTGEEVVHRLVVKEGATMRAKYLYDRDARPIFSGLGEQDLIDLSKLIRARTAIEAGRRDPKFQHAEGVTTGELEGWVRKFADKDRKRFLDLESRADKVFAVYAKQIHDIFNAGLLSPDAVNKLLKFNYRPEEYVRLLDPTAEFSIKGESLSLPDSGIPYMAAGSGRVVLDARKLLSEHIARVQNRIMKNDAVKALYNLAEQNPDLDFVKVIPVKEWNAKGEAVKAPIPDGYIKLTHMEEGRQRVLAIDEDLGRQWLHRPPAMDSLVADVARIASGTSIVKALATSYNPLFPIAGLPMDAAHMFVAGRGYSGHLPIYLGELGVDMATVAKDAITRGPRYQQAIMEGMGFDFMTHQGRELIVHKRQFGQSIDPTWERARKVLSWVNETAEIEMRLAHRERLIKSGMPSWQATAIARDRLNFTTGGVISKAADTVIPYSNVAVQAWRSGLKEMARDPKKAAGKLTWATGAIVGVVGLNMMIDKEAWQDIPVYDKINGLPLLIPGLTFVDSAGNERHGYVVLRTDNTLAPLHALVVGAMEKQVYGKAPDGILAKTLATLPSILGNVTVPTLDAWYQYTTNTDTRADAPIYTGIKVPPELEYKGPAFAQPTSEVSKAIGDLTGLSPERLDRASKAVLPNNPYIGGLSAVGNMALDTQPPSVRTKTTMDMLAENQQLRRVIKFTHPAHREMNEIDGSVEKHGGKVKPLYDSVDAYAVKYADGKATTDEVKTWLSAQPPELQQQLAQRFKTGAAVEKVMRQEKASQEGSPSRVWWMKLSDAPAEVRAELFFSRWVSMDPEGRKRLERTAGALSAQGVGFVSDDFRAHFGKLRSQFSEDQR